MTPADQSTVRRARNVRKALAVIGLTAFLAGAAFAARGRLLSWRDARTARRELAAGRAEAAEAALGRWLRAEPGSAEAHFLKAQLALRKNDLPKADSELALARELGDSGPQLHRLQGLLLAQSGRPAEAEPLLRQALETDPGPDPEAARALARIYLGSFQLKRASAVLDRWSHDAPGNALPYLWRTEVDARTDPPSDQIIAHFRAALERDPLHQARFGLAEKLREMHRNAEAAREYDVYLEHRPDDPLGYTGAGRNALEMGDEAGATRHLDRALRLAPDDAVALAERALVDYRRGDFTAALHRFNRAVRSDPFDADVRYRRSQTLDRLGRADDARADREAFARLRKDGTHLEQIRQRLLRSPNDLSAKSEMARWMVEHGHVDEGLDWARLVLRERPSEPAMNRLLADYYRAQGNLGLANFYLSRMASQGDAGTTGP